MTPRQQLLADIADLEVKAARLRDLAGCIREVRDEALKTAATVDELAKELRKVAGVGATEAIA